MRSALTHTAWIDHESGWIERDRADRLLAIMRDELAWEQREVVIYGRRMLQPRLIAWAGELGYTYSGQTLEPRAATPTVAELLNLVSARAGVAFNHVLANRYRDGRDSMGFHADDEPELGEDPVVASLSLGAARRFVVKPRHRSIAEPRTFQVGHGDLVVMGGAFQRQFHHGIPRDARVEAERISLTFRRLAR